MLKQILALFLTALVPAVLAWGQSVSVSPGPELKPFPFPRAPSRTVLALRTGAPTPRLRAEGSGGADASAWGATLTREGGRLLIVSVDSLALDPRRLELQFELPTQGLAPASARAFLVRPLGEECPRWREPALTSAELEAAGCRLERIPSLGGTVSLTEEGGRIAGALLGATFADPEVGAVNLLFILDGVRSAAGPSERAKAALEGLSIEEKVGQVLMIAIDKDIAAKYEPLIRDGKLGGALLRWDKFTAEGARDFSDGLQEMSGAAAGRPGLLVAADHEGGAVFTQRSFGATIFPGNMALGAAGSTALTERAARASARELKAMGIHMDFAPVLDVNSNPDNPIIGPRSFSEDPGAVARHGIAAVKGYNEGGVAAVVKHWPGHGDTDVDSHTDLPRISKTLDALERVDLAPFRAAVTAGARTVMPAHILFPALDPDLPVTLSKKAIAFLREKTGFDGVVVSDSMDMGAITKMYGSTEAPVMALNAGVDLLLLGKGDYPGIYDTLLAAVRSGRVAAERLDEAVRRVLALKDGLGLLRGGKADRPGLETVGSEENKSLAQDIAEKAVTLVRNSEGLIPLRLAPEKRLFVVAAHNGNYRAELEGFFGEIASRHAATESRMVSHTPDQATIDDVLARAQTADVVIIGTYHWGAAGYKGQTELVRRLQALGKPLVVASLMSPYDLKNHADAQTAIAAYGLTPASLRAAARLIFGEIAASGRLPVTIPSPIVMGPRAQP